MPAQPPHRIRIKICGITSVADAQLAATAGADAIGLVFYGPSPRAVTIEQAREIAYSVGPFVTLVGLFVDAEQDFIEQVLARVPLHLLQFHGSESQQFCELFQRPYMKAIRMRPELDLQQAIAGHPNAVAILLDAYRPGVPGGTGETFDWQRIPTNSALPLVLAGGLTPENIALAVSSTSVYGVDVSGGVESSPGKKNGEKIRAFIDNARRA
ncbi:MAG TPA: phosphoribosylanthranilate isomerase [Cellvibrio sp.]|nr:phosphoribosylanthranilate isomerase [Cellvibrio sp.]